MQQAEKGRLFSAVSIVALFCSSWILGHAPIATPAKAGGLGPKCVPTYAGMTKRQSIVNLQWKR
jgi:hypothetical protein